MTMIWIIEMRQISEIMMKNSNQPEIGMGIVQEPMSETLREALKALNQSKEQSLKEQLKIAREMLDRRKQELRDNRPMFYVNLSRQRGVKMDIDRTTTQNQNPNPKQIIIVTGSRYAKPNHFNEIKDQIVAEIREDCLKDVTIFHGAGVAGDCDSDGVDKITSSISFLIGANVREFAANWKMFGRSAWPIRNNHMIAEALADPDCTVSLIAFPMRDLDNKGTMGCFNEAVRREINSRIWWIS